MFLRVISGDEIFRFYYLGNNSSVNKFFLRTRPDDVVISFTAYT